MFSPILAIFWEIASSTVCSGSAANFCALRAATSAAPASSAWSTSALANSWNSEFLETKSVSQLSSIMAALWSSPAMAISPSLAARCAFLAAAAKPLVLRTLIASSMSPPASTRAFLQSIIPAPVRCRSSFTALAVTLIS